MQYRTTGTARTVPEPDNAYHLKNRFYRNETEIGFGFENNWFGSPDC